MRTLLSSSHGAVRGTPDTYRLAGSGVKIARVPGATAAMPRIRLKRRPSIAAAAAAWPPGAARTVQRRGVASPSHAAPMDWLVL
jgi:hypothetical protein